VLEGGEGIWEWGLMASSEKAGPVFGAEAGWEMRSGHIGDLFY